MSYYPIHLDKGRTLHYGMKAISLIEKKLGKPIAQINFEADMTTEDAVVLIWAGLVHEDKALTVEDVLDLLDSPKDFEQAMLTAGEALQDAFMANTGTEKNA